MLRMRKSGRNPFAYPGGNAAFNPQHPMANGLVRGNGFSGVAFAGNFLNLLNGTPGTVVSTPSSNVLGAIGHCIGYTSSACTTFSGNSTAVNTQATLAAIVQFDSTPVGTTVVVAETGSASAGYALAVTSGAKLQVLCLGGTNAASTTIGVVGNVPYFLVVSSGPSGSSAYLVLVNLATGAMLTDTISRAVPSATANSGVYNIGNTTVSVRAANGKIAAAMYSPSFFSLQQLVMFGADPWSFWYPKV